MFTSTLESQARKVWSPEALQAWLVEDLASRLGIERGAIDTRERFNRYGLDSVKALALLAALSTLLDRRLSPTLIWDHPTIEALSASLAGDGVALPRGASPRAERSAATEPVAIIGLSCRFPGAPNAEAFWRLLTQGVDAIREVPADRWDIDALYAPDATAPGMMSTRWGGFLEQVDRFDAHFFSISPREAIQMDPQQRLVMELCWEALEDAGVLPERLRGSRTGVFMGAMWSDYARLAPRGTRYMEQHTATGQDLSLITGRVSYTLGLQGPSLTLNTACSSSLVSVHLACQSLREGESTLALAGGVNLIMAPDSTVAMSKFGAMAPDGRSKAFDARANGYVRGEGAGVVVLKRLSRALADGDPIRCVIRGSAMNNDGYSNGLTAPNPEAQEAVLRDAYQVAGVQPSRVHVVEAHGTGTMLGDPIEANALGAVVGVGRAPERPLRLGSVKTNIGHLEAAAGVAGLIKTVLSIEHRALPPSLHFESPNPYIAFDALHLDVVRSLTEWPDADELPLAGVSSFGFSGTNCHLVLEAAAASPAHVFALSADSPEALVALAGEAAKAIAEAPAPRAPLADVCYTAARGSTARAHRLALTVRSYADLASQLSSYVEGQGRPGQAQAVAEGRAPRPVFVFAGNGAQRPRMGRELLQGEPVFRAAIERCDAVIAPLTGWSVIDKLVTDDPGAGLDDIGVQQPVLFALQVALAALWRSWGIEPAAVIGHSVGEVAAAHVAGILDLPEAARVVVHRSRLQQRTAGQGAVLTVHLSLDEARELVPAFGGRLDVAACNGPLATVLSGEPRAIEELTELMQRRGVTCHRVSMDFAAHSPQMDPLMPELAAALGALQPRRAAVPMISTVTAAVLEGAACDTAYWVRNLREPVLFAQATAHLLREGHDLFLEIGPHPILGRMIEQSLRAAEPQGSAPPAGAGTMLASLRRGEHECTSMREALARLYTLGAAVRWRGLFPVDPRTIPLPFGPAPAADAAAEGEPARTRLLPLSAHTAEALVERARDIQAFVAERPDVTLDDLCYTASVRRPHHDHRLSLVFDSRSALDEQLRAFVAGEVRAGQTVGRRALSRRKTVFVFPGHGSQWLGMGRELFRQEPVFRESLAQVDRVVQSLVGWSVIEELEADEARSLLGEIDVVPPVLFAIGVALAALWRSWGVEPDAVVGHSMGEIAAAHVAGALSLADAAQLICRRSQLLRRVGGRGGMVVVELSVEQTRELLDGYEDRLVIAGSNSPRFTVISGDLEALGEILWFLEREKIFCRRVKIDYASHSPQMDPLLPGLLAALDGLTPGPTAIPMFSTVTGELIPGPALTAAYWARNLREPVLFSQTVQRLIATNHELFVEMSPHPILLPPIEEGLRHAGRSGETLSSLRREQGERRALLESLGALYAQGQQIDWSHLHPAGGRHVPLPAYPWQRQRYWLTDGATPAGGRRRVEAWQDGASGHPLLGAPFTVSMAPGSHLWTQALSVEALPYLKDHCVDGEVVVPGAAYVEMALSAATAALGAGAYTLEDVTFERMLVLHPEVEQTVEVVLKEEAPGQASFQVSSRGGEDRAWQRHARGTLQRSERPADADCRKSMLPDIQRRCLITTDKVEHYRRMEAHGLSYGACFQGVQALWCGPDEVLGRVQLAEGMSFRAGVYQVHPALLDACFQLLVTLVCAGEAEGTHVPVSLSRVRIHGELGRQVWVHGRLRGADGAEAGAFTGDLELVDDEGRMLGEVQGLRLQRLAASSAERQEKEAEWLYSLAWRRQPLEPATAPAPAARAGSWLLLLDQGGTGAALASALGARGEGCVRVVAGERSAPLEPGLYQVDPADPKGFEALLAEAFNEQKPCLGVLHFWSLDASAETSVAALNAALHLSCISALHLVQALSAQAWRDMPRVWFVTRGAQAVGTESAAVSVAQAPVWGLGRVLALEHPELGCTCLDLSPVPFTGEAEALVEELGANPSAGQIALRLEGRYTARLGRGVIESEPEPEPGTAAARRKPAGDRPFRLEIPEPGVLERLTLRHANRRPPGAGEVEIEVEAAGLNFIDVMKAMGIYPDPRGDVTALGMECAGRIARVGAGVVGFQVGDEVVAAASGSFSSFVTTSAMSVALKPAHLGFDEAATLPLSFMTALYAVQHQGRAQRGERILIHSASGGTGLAAIQVAQALGLEIFATAGSDEKRAFLRSLGVAHVMDSRGLSFAEEVLGRTGGEGVNLILNSLAGEAIAKNLEVLSPYGRFLEIGKRDIHQNSRLGLLHFRKSLSYVAIDLAGMAAERPALHGALLREVMQMAAAGTIKPLAREVMPVGEIEGAFRRMAQAKHIGKIVVTMRHQAVLIAPEAPPDGALRSDRTYLITGGLGGLGLSLAKWMVERGARHLALMGRRPASEEARAAIEAMQGVGAEVRVLRADVAEALEVEAALGVIAEQMPPLGGIVHAAGVLEDRTALQMDAASFHKATAPKVPGAWNLHALTVDTPLDFFVMYSSAASLVGSPGQSNYAAGNAFLDALAHQRRQLGLPGLSINWGPFSQVGLAAAEEQRGERLSHRGLGSLTPAEGERVLEQLLRRPSVAQVGVLQLNVRRWVEFYPSASGSALWSELVAEREGAPTRGLEVSALLSLVRSAEPDKRLGLLEKYLSEQVTRVLRLSPERLERRTAFSSVGMDSLMSIELKNRLEAGLGLRLSSTLLFTYPNLASLAGHLLGLVCPGDDSPAKAPPAARPEAADPSREQALQGLTNTEAAALLEAKLASFKEQE
jgi:acyl transferase domain-containing protein/NADPH:quinone reductase-like Zn-dependent oxidoreductase/acyl carrier protein